jgi:hypothetical protein
MIRRRSEDRHENSSDRPWPGRDHWRRVRGLHLLLNHSVERKKPGFTAGLFPEYL